MISALSNRFHSLLAAVGFQTAASMNPPVGGAETGRSQSQSPSGQQSYRYFPNGDRRYFAESFILGSEKFETLRPESFLFGENIDINLLNPEPLQVPFNLSMERSPVYPIRALIHVRRDSIRLVRIPPPTAAAITSDNVASTVDQPAAPVIPENYRLEFVFDCEAPVEISLRCLVREAYLPGGHLSYLPVDQKLSQSSPIYRYSSGGGQLFAKSDWSFCPATWPLDSWQIGGAGDVTSSILNPGHCGVPIVVRCRVLLPGGSNDTASINDDQNRRLYQEHVVFVGLERTVAESSGAITFRLKTVRQKLVDAGCGCVLLLHELYGASENRQQRDQSAPADESDLDSAGECVVCMSAERDTVLLPCRHLCVCATCGEALRSQCADCPICRIPFKALLRLRALRANNNPHVSSPGTAPSSGISPSTALAQLPMAADLQEAEKPPVMVATGENTAPVQASSSDAVADVVVPAGYEAVSLMDALYGSSGYANAWRAASASRSTRAPVSTVASAKPTESIAPDASITPLSQQQQRTAVADVTNVVEL